MTGAGAVVFLAEIVVYLRVLKWRMMIRILLIILGCVAVSLGVLGIFVPGLPTTPLLLLASWAFYRSSPKLQKMLLDSKVGGYIRAYEENKGMTLRSKVMAVGFMLVMCSVSIIFFIPSAVVKIIVAVAGLIGSIVVSFVVPTVKA